MTRQLGEKQEASSKALIEVVKAQMTVVAALASMKKELNLAPFPNEIPDKGLFTEPITVRMPRVFNAVKALIDSATET